MNKHEEKKAYEDYKKQKSKEESDWNFPFVFAFKKIGLLK